MIFDGASAKIKPPRNGVWKLKFAFGEFFRPACCRFDLTLGNLLHSCLRPFGKTKNSLLFSPEVEKCKKRPHLFFLLRFGFNRDPFFVPNSNRSSLNPPKAHPSKTNPMKATLLKARQSEREKPNRSKNSKKPIFFQNQF